LDGDLALDTLLRGLACFAGFWVISDDFAGVGVGATVSGSSLAWSFLRLRFAAALLTGASVG
jgi:hypothetical protein